MASSVAGHGGITGEDSAARITGRRCLNRAVRGRKKKDPCEVKKH